MLFSCALFALLTYCMCLFIGCLVVVYMPSFRDSLRWSRLTATRLGCNLDSFNLLNPSSGGGVSLCGPTCLSATRLGCIDAISKTTAGRDRWGTPGAYGSTRASRQASEVGCGVPSRHWRCLASPLPLWATFHIPSKVDPISQQSPTQSTVHFPAGRQQQHLPPLSSPHLLPIRPTPLPYPRHCSSPASFGA